MPDPTRRRARLVLALKIALVVVLLGGVYHTLRQGFADLRHHSWNVRPWWLAASSGLYLLSILPSALYWHRILHVLDQRPRLWETVRAYYIGHLGKYVPGKAMVVVLRCWLIQGRRVESTVAAVSVFVETLTMMAVGAFWAATILLIAFPQHRWLFGLAIALMLAAGLPTWPPLFRRLYGLLPARLSDAAAGVDFQRFSYALVAKGWIGISIGWWLMGLSLWATLEALGTADLDPIRQWPLFTATVSLAVVAGFLSGIPGGALVREGILWLLLAQRFSEATAVVSGLLLRMVWLLSELTVSGILYVGVRRTGDAVLVWGIFRGVRAGFGDYAG